MAGTSRMQSNAGVRGVKPATGHRPCSLAARWRRGGPLFPTPGGLSSDERLACGRRTVCSQLCSALLRRRVRVRAAPCECSRIWFRGAAVERSRKRWTRISGFAYRESYIDGRRRIIVPLTPHPPRGVDEMFNNPAGIAWREGTGPNGCRALDPMVRASSLTMPRFERRERPTSSTTSGNSSPMRTSASNGSSSIWLTRSRCVPAADTYSRLASCHARGHRLTSCRVRSRRGRHASRTRGQRDDGAERTAEDAVQPIPVGILRPAHVDPQDRFAALARSRDDGVRQ